MRAWHGKGGRLLPIPQVLMDNLRCVSGFVCFSVVSKLIEYVLLVAVLRDGKK